MYSFFKAFFDRLFAGLLLLSLLPLLIVVYLISIYKGITKPVFSQKRPGLNEKIFTLYKFKTMADTRDENGQLLPDSQRLTAWGRFLRKTSLDEIPQLFNVLSGDMSFVGPRPLLVQYLPLYNGQQRKRHLVKPGITGWAQVNGRNAISWEQKFDYDLWYVENQSFLLDVKILFLTFWKVIKKEGITSENTETMSAFEGNERDE